ncbi:MAG: hypothetical protein WD021_09340 [Rhodothermales bacterium]
MGLLALAGAVGLIPLVLYAPRHDGWRYTLLFLVCLYAGRKIVRFVRARRAQKQLNVEEHVLRYGSSGRRVQKCIQNGEHMWTHSRIVAVLTDISRDRFPTELTLEARRRRIYTRYRQAFRDLRPQNGLLDTVLVVSVAGLTGLVPTIEVDLRTVLFLGGFLALSVVASVECVRWFADARLSSAVDRWFGALSEWTLRDCLEVLQAHESAYSHRVLYYTQPWFAGGPSSKGGTSDDDLVLRAGDGLNLPSTIMRDDDAPDS